MTGNLVSYQGIATQLETTSKQEQPPRKATAFVPFKGIKWRSRRDSNPRPPSCLTEAIMPNINYLRPVLIPPFRLLRDF
jgi:hypothetical protein